ncbi:MAG TPA: hypothetical protein PKY59_02185 [Pyrinomonadaceae bacterium]|nr:hypothetical protein [Pyrinomonadaceae bacterium]
MNNSKFLGICILVMAFMISGSLIYHAHITASVGRYQIHSADIPGFVGNPVVLDTKTGEVRMKDGQVLVPEKK